MNTRDGRDIRISRAQVRIRVPSFYVNGWPQTDGDLEVRLQSPAWLEQWRPAGNRTWVDSSVDDFEMGSSRTPRTSP